MGSLPRVGTADQIKMERSVMYSFWRTTMWQNHRTMYAVHTNIGITPMRHTGGGLKVSSYSHKHTYTHKHAYCVTRSLSPPLANVLA